MEHQEHKTRWFGIASVWFGGVVSVPALLLGSILITSLSFGNSVVAGLLGFGFVVLFMSFLSIAAVEKRKATVALASSSFGELGAKIVVALIIGLSSLGWFGVQSNIAGASFAKIVTEMNGPELPVWICSVFWGAVMVLTAVLGFKYLKWLNYIAVPAITVLLVYGLIVTFKDHSFSEVLQFEPQNKMPFFQAIGVAIGFVAVGGVISPDYNRFAATKKDAILGAVFGIIPAALALLAIGAILAITQGTYDIVEIFSSLGFPFFAMSILILATWTTNVVNIYSAGLAFNNLLGLSEASRSKTTLIAGILGIVLAALGILAYVTDFITLLTATITPIAGVMLSDYFLSKTYGKNASKLNWKGLLAWAAGVVILFAMENPIKNILGIVIAAIIYFILQKITTDHAKDKH